MKKVFIKYNPYKLETEITIEGKKYAENSRLSDHISDDSRLQEWVEELPQILIDEYNDRDFNIIFHGTLLDYEDITETFKSAYENGKLTAKLDRIPAKETEDKEVLIDKIFKKIQEGPFDELRDVQILNSFEHAKSENFEACVVATMSAGKSTLINSMLGKKLMPSKQEACTAIITKIKDIEDNENSWSAKVYDKENELIGTHEKLDYTTMVRLNEDEKVSEINIEGNIPFVSAEDVSLVLIDTPGPNNSRNPEHRKVQSEFLSKTSKSLVIYIMDSTFGTDDDNALIKRVADSMKVGGKQSKDRFTFVVNKLDNLGSDDGDLNDTLDRVRVYLKNHGIENPSIFPAAALPALNIRLIESGYKLDEDTRDETELKVTKLNRNENLHFEKYSNLPPTVKEDISRQLNKAEEADDANEKALIHTGIVSIEAAIRQYVQKYAKTAKIRNIVDTFMHKLDELGCYEKTKSELSKNQNESKKIVEHIDNIRRKVDDVKAAKEFKGAVDDAVREVGIESEDVVDEIVGKFQAKITQRIDKASGREIDKEQVDEEVTELEKFAEELEPEFQTDLDELIRRDIIKTSNNLLDEYRKKLVSLTEVLDDTGLSGISIEPLNLMGGSLVAADNFSVENIIKSKSVEDGKEWIENTNKKWYKPWTWSQERGYYKKKYKSVKYVDASELAQEFFTPIKENVINNGKNAKEYTHKQCNKIAEHFSKEFRFLDGVLKEKLDELESFVTDKEKADERIKESEAKLRWLKTIQSQVEEILEI